MKKWTLAVTSLAAASVFSLYLWTRNESGADDISNQRQRRAASESPAAEKSLRDNSTELGDSGPLLKADLGRPASPVRSAYRLEAEEQYFSDGDISLTTVERYLTGKEFNQAQAQLERQMQSNPDASDLTQLYRQALQSQLVAAGLAEGHHRLACGLSVCMGSLTSRAGERAYEKWWGVFEASADAPHTIGIDYSLDLGGGLYEHRYFFVTDPETMAIRSRPRG